MAQPYNLTSILDTKALDTYLLDREPVITSFKNQVLKEIKNRGDIMINEAKFKFENDIGLAILALEKDIKVYIDNKFDSLAEKIVDKIIQRKFNEEVDKKVKQKLSERGKF